MEDPLKVAMEHALTLYEIAKAARVGGEALRRRARDFPSLMAEAGLVPALLFYLSRADDDKLEAAIEALRDGPKFSKKKPSEYANKLKEELGKEEAAGYSVLVAAVVEALRRLADIRLECRHTESEDTSITASIVAGLLDLRDRGEEGLAASILEPYLVELKKLAEAFFEKEER